MWLERSEEWDWNTEKDRTLETVLITIYLFALF